MTSKLPPGVPESNKKQDFSAIEPAAPTFDGAQARDLTDLLPETAPAFFEQTDPAEDDDDAPAPRRRNTRPPQNVDAMEFAGLGLSNQAILLLIGLIFVGLTAYLITKNREPIPLCSEQPEWNQYNCRSG